jgi:hypothetical protein
MNVRAPDRTGILVLRVWMEDAADGFRARVTHTLDSAGPEKALSAAASPDQIYAIIRAWVEAFVDPDLPR